MNVPIHRSRTLASVARLASADCEHRFLDCRVLLTGDAAALATQNGAEMMSAAMQLLMRICPDVDVAVPVLATPLAAKLEEEGERFAWDKMPRFVGPGADLYAYDAILSVGGTVRPELPWTAIAANGWIARVSSGASPIVGDCGVPNPISSLGAASLGVCEVFKRLIGLKEEAGELLDGLSFSLWDFHSGGKDGPPIPSFIPCNLMVNGAGAIGSGIVHGLIRLPLSGDIIIVDRQDYGDENWGTCIGLESAEIGDPKALVAAKRFGPGVKVHPYKMTIKEAAAEVLGIKAPWPDLLLNGLDDVDSRHEAQDLWPDLIFDGALDADLQVRASAHPWASGLGCLRCLYRHASGESAEAKQQRLTGLAPDSLRDQERVLTEEDIQRADPQHRQKLCKSLGRRICSVVSTAQEMSDKDLGEGFAPSVPFAATLSASLILAEFVRHAIQGDFAAPLYQMSLLMGPATGQLLPTRREPDCLCCREREMIVNFRSRQKPPAAA